MGEIFNGARMHQTNHIQFKIIIILLLNKSRSILIHFTSFKHKCVCVQLLQMQTVESSRFIDLLLHKIHERIMIRSSLQMLLH